jgi:SnoaL-like domain
MYAEGIDIAALKRAIETRDARTMATFYADDARLRIIDCDNPPSKPRELAGKGAIVAYYDDVCSRAMTHSMESGVADGERLAFTQACAYPDGTRVFCAAMIELAGGKIPSRRSCRPGTPEREASTEWQRTAFTLWVVMPRFMAGHPVDPA